MKITGFLTPSYGWGVQSDSEYLLIPHLRYANKPGKYIAFVGNATSKYLNMAAIGDDMDDMINHIRNHYIFDFVFITVVEYL